HPEEARRILDKVTAAAPGYMLGHLHLAQAHRALALARRSSENEPKRDPLTLLSGESEGERSPARAGPTAGPMAGPAAGLDAGTTRSLDDRSREGLTAALVEVEKAL